METYRLSSKLRENEREYLIQTANDVPSGAVGTTVYVNGVRTEEMSCPHPEDIPQDQLLALVRQAHGEKKKELEALLQAYRTVSEQGDPGSMFRLAEALFSRRLYNDAAELLGRIVRVSPDHHQAFNQLGLALFALGRTDEAIRAASEAVACRPEFADYRNNLGEAYLAAGSVAEAAAEFGEAIAINMYYADAYFNLGLTHALEAAECREREQTKALVIRVRELVSKASLVQPAYSDHRNYAEGLTALENHDFGRALSLFRSVRESQRESRLRESASLHTRLAFDLEAGTEEAVATHISSLEAELQKHPNYLDLQTELARCYLQQARLAWHKGIAGFRKVAESHPSLDGVAQALEIAEPVNRSITEAVATIGKEAQQ